jgi:putative transposase
LDQWSEDTVRPSLTRPDKPTQNAFIQSFKGRSQDECPNENWFNDLHHARTKIEA